MASRSESGPPALHNAGSDPYSHIHPRYHRSNSVPNAIQAGIPTVTISDYSSKEMSGSLSDLSQRGLQEPDEQLVLPEEGESPTYVTLEDVAHLKRKHPRNLNSSGQSVWSASASEAGAGAGGSVKLMDDTWSYTNSSVETGEDGFFADLGGSGPAAVSVAADSEEAGRTVVALAAEPPKQPVKQTKKASGWRKVRSVVQWTPFIQTYKHKKYQWVQLAGHSGNFKPGQNQGTVLKKRCPKEELCYEQFIGDSLADYVPRFQGTVVSDDDEKFIQLQDCLSSFNLPSIMDCKIGVRTYLEEELAKAKEKPKLRKDMYEKMVLVDPTAPTEYEHQMKGVTKPRYMVWRETISSTATLGFRLEGVKRSDGTSSKDFKTTKTRQQVTEAFHSFLAGSVETAKQYLVRLKEINEALKVSKFFKTHELIGSSLLFVHDAKQASIWLIDFGKTVPVPDGLSIDHRSPWEEGNHEDGYMIGVENLVSIFGELAAGRTTTTTPSEPGRAPAENAAALAAGRTSRSAAESVAVPAETGASVAAPAAPREDLSAAK